MAMKISVYGTEGCPWTEKVLEWFDNKGIKKFTFHDAISDFSAREDMVRKSGQHSVPVVDMDGEIIVGYNQKELERTLLK